jgi:DNA adenine methylase
MNPFLKWPGGKRWFIANYVDLLPKRFNRYIEPFLGSGSVFFFLQPRQALLGDINADLIATYNGIKEDPVALESLLQKHHESHSKRHYYKVRHLEPIDPIERAARLIYLNRTCFNGIYRVNLQGKFNVPMGTKDSVVLGTDDFEQVASVLANAEIRVSDFKNLIEEAIQDDLIFADPPYTVRHNLNGFIKYNETLFSWDDQLRLADALARARDRGAKIVSTNANHASVRGLYEDRDFTLKIVSRFSSISAKSTSRRPFEELVITTEQI